MLQTLSHIHIDDAGGLRIDEASGELAINVPSTMRPLVVIFMASCATSSDGGISTNIQHIRHDDVSGNSDRGGTEMTLTGGVEDNRLFGGAGNDTLYGRQDDT